MRDESLPFAYRGVPAIVLRRIDVYSLPLIEYSWSCVSMIRKRMTKSKIYPFSYRRVLAIVLRRIDSYSLSLIGYLWNHVLMDQK